MAVGGQSQAGALFEAGLGLPGMICPCREIQRRGRRCNGEFLAGRGEATVFDAESYLREKTVAAFVVVLSRQCAVDPEAKPARSLLRGQGVNATGLGADRRGWPPWCGPRGCSSGRGWNGCGRKWSVHDRDPGTGVVTAALSLGQARFSAPRHPRRAAETGSGGAGGG